MGANGKPALKLNLTQYGILRRAELRTQWDRVNGKDAVRTRPMDPVLANAIKNPRMPKPYGGGDGDYNTSKTVRGVDTFVRLNRTGDKRTILAATCSVFAVDSTVESRKRTETRQRW